MWTISEIGVDFIQQRCRLSPNVLLTAVWAINRNSLYPSFPEPPSRCETKALAYTVPFASCFEPYVVVAKAMAPMYDERFRGYGMNKVRSLQTGG